MHKLSNDRLESILGGWADNATCQDLMEIADGFSKHPEDGTKENWDIWCVAFDIYCLGL